MEKRHKNILLIICTINLFLLLVCPLFTVNNEEYGKIEGVGSTIVESKQTSMTFLNMMNGSTILIILLILFAFFFFYLYFNKKKNFLLWSSSMLSGIITIVAPAITVIIGLISYKEDMKFIGNDVAVYGSGVSTNISFFGIVIIILSIVSLIYFLPHFIKSSKEITEVKKSDLKEIKNPNDWHF